MLMEYTEEIIGTGKERALVVLNGTMAKYTKDFGRMGWSMGRGFGKIEKEILTKGTGRITVRQASVGLLIKEMCMPVSS